MHRDIREPMDLAFSPAGQLWVTTRSGDIWTCTVDTKTKNLVGQLKVDSYGLHGIEFDPHFSTNGYLYVFYAPLRDNGHVNRLSRFNVSTKDGNYQLRMESEVVYLQFPFEHDLDHQGGAIQYNPKDGKLYIGTGDDLPNAEMPNFYNDPRSRPQDLADLRGKTLRLNPDGSVPADNPFVQTAGARAEIYTYGHRQAFTMTVDPPTGNVFVGDIGFDRKEDFEEINLLKAGGNYGWPRCIGPNVGTYGGDCPLTNSVSPWLSYARGTGACVICGPFYRKNDGRHAFPKAYHNGLFYADYVRRSIRFAAVDPETNKVINTASFALGFTCYPIALKLGPDGGLYLAEYSGYHQISRIIYAP